MQAMSKLATRRPDLVDAYNEAGVDIAKRAAEAARPPAVKKAVLDFEDRIDAIAKRDGVTKDDRHVGGAPGVPRRVRGLSRRRDDGFPRAKRIRPLRARRGMLPRVSLGARAVPDAAHEHRGDQPAGVCNNSRQRVEPSLCGGDAPTRRGRRFFFSAGRRPRRWLVRHSLGG